MFRSRKARRSIMLLFLGLCSMCASAAAAGVSQKPPVHTYTVVISGLQFHPPSITVHLGDTILWKNNDIFVHTVTDAGGNFDSGEIQPNTTWRFVPTRAGTIQYGCTPHPNMHGTLIVK